jgi:hypothetical protein
MKIICAALLASLVAAPVAAGSRTGQLGSVLKKAQEAKKKVDAAHISEQDERTLGEQVSA